MTSIAAIALLVSAVSGSAHATGQPPAPQASDASGALREIGDPQAYVPVPSEVSTTNAQAFASRRRLSSAPTPVGATTWQGSYFNNTSLSGVPALTRDDGTTLDFWWTGSPGPGVSADYFSVRWARTLNFSTGTYQFFFTHDDGGRVLVDGQLVMEELQMQVPTLYVANYDLPAGRHTVTVEYATTWGDAVARLAISQAQGAPSTPTNTPTTPTPTPTSAPNAPTATGSAPTAAATATTVPSAATPTPTSGVSAPTATSTSTPALPTATRTPVPPTATSTPTATAVPVASSGSSGNSPALMVGDATQAHEGCLDANYVQGYSWQYGPDPAYWNLTPPGGFSALTGWFAVTTDASPTCTTQSPVANVRVEIRQYKTYALANGGWTLVQDQANGGLGSALFFPNYQSNGGSLNLRDEPDGGQSWLPTRDGLWHGWPSARSSVPSGTTAVCSQFEARLVLDNPSGPDNRSSARMLAESGFDWWQTTSSGSNALGMNGRYKLVPQDGSYRWYNGCSASTSTLLSNPPPYQ